MSFAAMTDTSRNWRLAIFLDTCDWGLGPQVVVCGKDKWSDFRIEIHLRLGPIELQYIHQRDIAER